MQFADFDGDRRVDLLQIKPDGSVDVSLDKGGEGRGGWTPLGMVAPRLRTEPNRSQFADFNRDGRADSRNWPSTKVMSGAQSSLLPAVNGRVHGAPWGNTAPALRQAVRSPDVLITRFSPVCTSR